MFFIVATSYAIINVSETLQCKILLKPLSAVLELLADGLTERYGGANRLILFEEAAGRRQEFSE
jgi:hypothetical protein